jgi:hypothetical protein
MLRQHVTLFRGMLWLDTFLVIEPGLAQSQAGNMLLLTDTLVKTPCQMRRNEGPAQLNIIYPRHSP